MSTVSHSIDVRPPDNPQIIFQRQENSWFGCIINKVNALRSRITDWTGMVSLESSSKSPVIRFFENLGKIADGFLGSNRKILDFVEKKIFPQKTENKKKDLIPTAVVIALIGLLSNSCKISLGVVFLQFMITITSIFLFQADSNNANDPYHIQMDKTHPFHNTIISPLLEEIEFRGILQPLLAMITGSSSFGNLVSAGIFGALHLRNKHSNNHIQAFLAGFMGIFAGIMHTEYGLVSSVEFHAYWNTFLAIIKD